MTLPWIVSPAEATTYILGTDAELADRTPVIAQVQILEVESPRAGENPATRYFAQVEEVVQGFIPAATVVVRVPGGIGPEGYGLKIWGAPEFQPGDRALLFLSPRADGTYGIFQLLLGAFYEETVDGQRVAFRRLDEAQELHIGEGGEVELREGEDRVRDWDRFVQWLADRARGIRREADYFVELPAEGIQSLQRPFTLMRASDGKAIRWFDFDGGGSVSWRALAEGQPGVPGGGFTEFQNGLDAWNADGNSKISYTYAGTTGDSSWACSVPVPPNKVLFDDPNGDIDGSFSCGGGSQVVAIGGPCFTNSTRTYNGVEYHETVSARIVTQDGLACLFEASSNPGKLAEEIFGHELGHTLGIGHSCGDSKSGSCNTAAKSEALMRAFLHNDGRGAKLNSDDQAAAQCVYGDSSTCDGSSGGDSESPPTAPSNLTASTLSTTQIRLAWKDNSTNESEFRVEVKTSVSFQDIGSVPADSTGATVSSLDPGTTYTFRVRACNSAGCSAYSNEASATTESASPPAAPSDLTASAVSSTEVQLFWQDNSGDELDFRVEQKTTGSSYQEIAVVPANSTGIRIGGLQAATTYSFRVRARNSAGFSAYSNEASATTSSGSGSGGSDGGSGGGDEGGSGDGGDGSGAGSDGSLTLAEVSCDATRLAGFLLRLEVEAPNTQKSVGVNLSFTRMGDFAGIAYTGNGPGTAEHHLAFSTNPEETTLLRNPERLQLFSLSVTRNQLNSDLVVAGSEDELRLLLNTTLSQNPAPSVLLFVDNLADPDGKPTDSKPGRGLTELIQPCHGKFTEQDIHMFRVLSKVARAQATGASKYELAIYRGEGEKTYRIDVFPIGAQGESLGRLAGEIEVAYNGSGELTSGILRVLPRCTGSSQAGCTSVTGFTLLQLVHPKFNGDFWIDTPYGVFTFGKAGDGRPESPVDWSDLLGGTTWRSPM